MSKSESDKRNLDDAGILDIIMLLKVWKFIYGKYNIFFELYIFFRMENVLKVSVSVTALAALPLSR